jgi:hypothetical protein
VLAQVAAVPGHGSTHVTRLPLQELPLANHQAQTGLDFVHQQQQLQRVRQIFEESQVRAGLEREQERALGADAEEFAMQAGFERGFEAALRMQQKNRDHM